MTCRTINPTKKGVQRLFVLCDLFPLPFCDYGVISASMEILSPRVSECHDSSELPNRSCCVTAQLTVSRYSKPLRMWPERSRFCSTGPSAVFTYKLNRNGSVCDLCGGTYGTWKCSCLMCNVSSAVQLWFKLVLSVTSTFIFLCPTRPLRLIFLSIKALHPFIYHPYSNLSTLMVFIALSSPMEELLLLTFFHIWIKQRNLLCLLNIDA